MEKFGIFELLDALAAVTSPEGEGAPRPAEGEGPVPPPEKTAPDASESAFAPPSYAAPERKDPPKGAEIFPPREKGNAASSLLERHEKMSRRIDKNK